jgi:hypothetical protein
MLLLGHYMYLTVPFFEVALIAKLAICNVGVSLFTYGGPKDCEYVDEKCTTDQSGTDEMSCRGMSQVVLLNLFYSSALNGRGGSP